MISIEKYLYPIFCAWLAMIAGPLIATNALASPPDLGDYFSAAKKFEKLIIENKKQNKMPLLQEKGAASLIQTLSDKRFIKPEKYSVSDLNSLLDVCDKANAFVKTYVYFNATQRFMKSKNSNKPLSYQEILDGNVEQFQNELSKLHPFQIYCMATQIPLLEGFVQSLKPEEITPIRIDGLKRARSGMLLVYKGLLQEINNEKLKHAYRLELIKAVSKSSPVFARFLHVSQREKIVNMATGYNETAPSAFKPHLEFLILSMQVKTCENLCRY